MNDKILKVKLLTKDAKMPIRAHKTDAGADLCSTDLAVIYPGEMQTISTGVSIALDTGYVGLVFSRSGLGKIRVNLTNAVGVIDAAYRGEIKLMVQNEGNDPFTIQKGDRVAQLVITPVYTADFIEYKGSDEEWLDTSRGGNGFGSTGLGHSDTTSN